MRNYSKLDILTTLFGTHVVFRETSKLMEIRSVK